MKTVKVYTAEELRDFDFTVAGQNLSTTAAMNLKVYAGSTIYLKNKKVALSEEDLNTIDNAKQIYFLYNCEGKCFLINGSFSTTRFGHGEYTPSNVDAFKNLLIENNITVTEN